MEVSKSQGLPVNYPKAGTCMALLPSLLSHRKHKLLPQNAQSWGPLQSSLSKLRLTSHWSQTPKSSPVFPFPKGGREKEHMVSRRILFLQPSIILPDAAHSPWFFSPGKCRASESSSAWPHSQRTDSDSQIQILRF